MIRQIKSLLYEQGYTIGGARQKMTDSPEEVASSQVRTGEIKALIRELEEAIKSL